MEKMLSYLPWLAGWVFFGIGQAVPATTYLTLAMKVLILGAARILPQAPFGLCA